MKIINNWRGTTEKEITEFISKSTPEKNDFFKFVQGREDYGWVRYYFDNSGKLFRITQSCADEDLSDLVRFFKNIINLQEEYAVVLDDEACSEPFLYASPVDDEHIRFLVADGSEIYTKCEKDDFDIEPQLSDYEIMCDVIVNKKMLLKEFTEAINNVIRMNNCSDTQKHYDICYDNWKGNFEKILKWCNKA